MYISVLILWGWNRVVSLYTEVSLFQGVGFTVISLHTLIILSLVQQILRVFH